MNSSATFELNRSHALQTNVVTDVVKQIRTIILLLCTKSMWPSKISLIFKITILHDSISIKSSHREKETRVHGHYKHERCMSSTLLTKFSNIKCVHYSQPEQQRKYTNLSDQHLIDLFRSHNHMNKHVYFAKKNMYGTQLTPQTINVGLIKLSMK
jgi:hypothetical protein